MQTSCYDLTSLPLGKTEVTCLCRVSTVLSDGSHIFFLSEGGESVPIQQLK